ncbi:MAG: sigma-54-dependent Fis family transcriptional regulator [Myxococcales bacterium]|nr:sigma-54-dependent Fis family transcriptional regulator [Myxococcales bacterium]
MGEHSVLVVDDRANMLSLAKKVLGKDVRVLTASGGREALEVLKAQPVSVVVCDLRMPDMEGIEVLRECKRLRPNTEFILMTAYASVATAVEALRLGAYDYITKPFDPDQLRGVVLSAVGRSAPASEPNGDDPTPKELLPGLVGRSPPMRELAAQVVRYAASDATALVIGETGTGKERIARALHTQGDRASQRFVAVNCAAIPAELLESELFGYAKGAFSGASRDRGGLFEEANHGTLFLDEIGELRLSLQAKLTRAIEEKAVRRLGESRERSVDVRLVAATHRDLEAMVKAGTFREDLWYRLNVARVSVPPLRERKDDIPLLSRHFLRERAASISDRRIEGFSDEALARLSAYDWPGNVRQLRSAVERAYLLAPGDTVNVSDLPDELLQRRAPSGGSELANLTWQAALEHAREEAAQLYLSAVMERFDGRVADAAAHAGIERESFYRLLRRYGVRSEGG